MKVRLNTSHGEIVLSLNEEKAPITVENFVSYVKSGHYDGTIFHRVIYDFMIQAGGMNPDMSEKPTGECIRNEANNSLGNLSGTIAMARRPDPHSDTGVPRWPGGRGGWSSSVVIRRMARS